MSGSAVKAGKRAAYPAYKPSGVAWLGDVPEHWEVRRLKYTADLINVKVEGAGHDLPYTGLEHIESWTGRRITPNGDGTSDGQANLYRRGDVLFGKLRPYLAKAHAAESDGICTGELLVLRPRAVAQKFLLNYVLNPDFIAVVDSSTYGAKMPRANWDFIGNLPALIPPSDEQRAIAAFLDRETARIDALIEKKRRQIELLQEKRSALISHAVTKGLDPNAPMKDSGIEWLSEVPEHWAFSPLKYVASFINGAPFKPSEWQDEGVPIIRIENLNGGEDFNFSGDPLPEKYHVQEGDLLFGWSGNRGTSFGPFIWWRRGLHYLNQHIFRIADFAFAKRWFYWTLKAVTFYVEKQAHGIIGMVHITKGDLGAIKIPIVSHEEQRAIADYLDCETERIDRIIRTVQDSIGKLHEFRTALISAAVTGKIDVRGEVG